MTCGRSDNYFRLDGLATLIQLIKVPGLAENRPSVVYADKIYITLSTDTTNTEFEGIVHSIDREVAILQFDPFFKTSVFVTNKQFNVRFSISRSIMRRCHQGISLLSEDDIPWNFITPSYTLESNEPRKYVEVADVNGLNEEQMTGTRSCAILTSAVRNIVNRTNVGVPYIIHGIHNCTIYNSQGGPGSGKTKTMIESIIACHKTSRGTQFHFLCLAPSNTAADLFVERLSLVFPRSEMYRMNAHTREKTGVLPEVEKYSSFDEKMGVYDLESLEKILKYKVVIATLQTASYLYGMGVQRGHFSHYFIGTI